MSINKEQANQLAVELEGRMRARTRYLPVRQDNRGLDVDEAYDVQDVLVSRLENGGFGRCIGYKIGLTSSSLLSLFGVTEPICGRIFSSRFHRSGAILQASSYGRIGVECELAILIRETLGGPVVLPNAHEIAAATSAVHAAFEIIDDRGAHLCDVDAGSIVAENGWNAGLVVGEGISLQAITDVNSLQGTLYCNGERSHLGRSGDILGGPLGSLAWLIEFLSRRKRFLQAGQWVLTGAIIPPQYTGAR